MGISDSWQVSSYHIPTISVGLPVWCPMRPNESPFKPGGPRSPDRHRAVNHVLGDHLPCGLVWNMGDLFRGIWGNDMG